MLTGRFDFRRDGRPWFSIRNGVTTQGATALLGIGFGGVSAILPYVGLIGQSGFTGLASADTHATHPGWNEWTNYAGNRPAWIPSPATGGNMGTLTAFQWVMNAGGQLRGAFLASTATKGSSPAAILYCTAVASSPLSVVNTQLITCSYTLTIGE